MIELDYRQMICHFPITSAVILARHSRMTGIQKNADNKARKAIEVDTSTKCNLNGKKGWLSFVGKKFEQFAIDV